MWQTHLGSKSASREPVCDCLGTMTRVDDRWFLPIEGLVSGFLTCLFPALPLGLGDALFLFLGGVFGAVIAAHALFFRGVRSAFRLIGFIATCAVAYTVSVFATQWTPFRPQFLNFSGTGLGGTFRCCHRPTVSELGSGGLCNERRSGGAPKSANRHNGNKIW